MRNGATSTHKMLRRQWGTDASGKPSPDQWFSEESWRHTLTCAPLIKGNFKDPNPWSYSVRSSSGLVGKTRRTAWPPGPNKSTINEDGLLTSDPTYIWLPFYDFSNVQARATNIALGRLNEKIRGSLDLAVDLAEAGQTLKMTNLVNRFVAGIADMKASYRREVARKVSATRRRQQLSSRLRRWERGLGARYPSFYRPLPPATRESTIARIVGGPSSLLANGWLEYSYGWKPLIGSIYGIAENVVGFVRNNDKVSASGKEVISFRTTVPYSFSGITVPGGIPVELEGKAVTRYAITMRPNYDLTLAKWSSLNPYSLAWELMPYSFVIDWFLDIGSYMRNLETALIADNQFNSGIVSKLVYCRIKAAVSSSRYVSTAGEWQEIRGSAEKYQSDFSRVKLPSYPLPTLPSFQMDLGASRLLSAAALLRGFLPKGAGARGPR
jgi:hypothetical protein